MRTFLTVLSLILSHLSFTQGSFVADSKLIEGAHEMILSEETHFIIRDINQSSLSKKYLVCILDKYASNKNNLILHYDDFSKIREAKATVYNKNLEEIKSYKIKDFKDYSASGSNMASDSRAKLLTINERTFPYFIQVDYTIDHTGSLHYPRWIAQEDEKISVVSSQLTVESFLDEPFRFHANIPANDSLIENKHFKYTWRADSLPAFTWKSYSYDASDYTPMVLLAPGKFQMNGIVGDLSSWGSFGEWINLLNKDQNTFTEIEKEQIRGLVDPNDSKLEKTKKIYQFLQDNTRYVSIQLGIGGWKPFETGFVHNNKFGDCKALSYYTLSMLREVGVDAFYTLIRAGRSAQEIKPNFPSAHFNHAILTVPIGQDTIWLECTSQDNPFGYLGTFTSDRDALLIDGENSRIIHTRKYETFENSQNTVVNLTISREGVGNGHFRRTYHGIEVENDGLIHTIHKTEREKNEWFIDNHDWGDMSVHDLTLSELNGTIIPEANLSGSLELRNAASKMGDRMFFNPFKFTNIDGIILPDTERQVPLEIRYPFSQSDSVTVSFDEVFYPERSISNDEIISDYGSYSVEVIQTENRYLFIRNFSLEKGVYLPSEYQDFKKFIESVHKADRQKLVLINKT